MELCIFKHIFLPMMKTLPSFPPYESGSHGLHCGGSVSSCTCVLSHVQPLLLLCPWDSPDKNIGLQAAPGDLRDPGTEPASLVSPALAGRFFTTGATWRALLLGSGSSPAPLEEGGPRGLCGVWPPGDPSPCGAGRLQRGFRQRAQRCVVFIPGFCLSFPGAWPCLSDAVVQRVVWEVDLSVCTSSVGGSWQAQLTLLGSVSDGPPGWRRLLTAC